MLCAMQAGQHGSEEQAEEEARHSPNGALASPLAGEGTAFFSTSPLHDFFHKSECMSVPSAMPVTTLHAIQLSTVKFADAPVMMVNVTHMGFASLGYMLQAVRMEVPHLH